MKEVNKDSRIQKDFTDVISTISLGMDKEKKKLLYPYMHKAWFDGFKKGIDHLTHRLV